VGIETLTANIQFMIHIVKFDNFVKKLGVFRWNPAMVE